MSHNILAPSFDLVIKLRLQKAVELLCFPIAISLVGSRCHLPNESRRHGEPQLVWRLFGAVRKNWEYAEDPTCHYSHCCHYFIAAII
jgi:hypothetical protein